MSALSDFDRLGLFLLTPLGWVELVLSGQILGIGWIISIYEFIYIDLILNFKY